MSYYADIEEIDVLEDIEVDIEQSDIGIGNVAYLIVHNDDVNSFDWVIECFTDILNHAPDQAEQLAVIIHSKGKATVKTAAYSVLKPKKDALCDRGLSAIIEGGNEEEF